jgi:hypothetical protein
MQKEDKFLPPAYGHKTHKHFYTLVSGFMRLSTCFIYATMRSIWKRPSCQAHVFSRHWKDHFKSDLRSDQVHHQKNDLRSDQEDLFF